MINDTIENMELGPDRKLYQLWDTETTVSSPSGSRAHRLASRHLWIAQSCDRVFCCWVLF